MKNIKDVIISCDKSLLDVDAIHTMLDNTYWSKGREKSTVEKSIENSICYGAYIGDKQVGFLRMVTDYATMYWLCDVVVDSQHRAYGIGKAMLEQATSDDRVKDCFGILSTKDAHKLYEKYKFGREPRKFMRKRKDER